MKSAQSPDTCQACNGQGGTIHGGRCHECYGQGTYSGAQEFIAPPSQEAGTAGASEALSLSYELLGVIVDVEEGRGFDEVCLRTIKRVHAALSAPLDAPKGEPTAAERLGITRWSALDHIKDKEDLRLYVEAHIDEARKDWEAQQAAQAPEPVAWQERQKNCHGGWSSWYDSNSRRTTGETEAFEVVSSGIPYQFRPLYAAPVASQPMTEPVDLMREAMAWTSKRAVATKHRQWLASDVQDAYFAGARSAESQIKSNGGPLMTRWANFEDPVEWFCAARIAHYQQRSRYVWFCLLNWAAAIKSNGGGNG